MVFIEPDMKENFLSRQCDMQKKFQKHVGMGREQGCAKSLYINDLQKTEWTFKFKDNFSVSTPPQTQVKNVTMSQSDAVDNVAPPWVSKTVLLHHL